MYAIVLCMGKMSTHLTSPADPFLVKRAYILFQNSIVCAPLFCCDNLEMCPLPDFILNLFDTSVCCWGRGFLLFFISWFTLFSTELCSMDFKDGLHFKGGNFKGLCEVVENSRAQWCESLTEAALRQVKLHSRAVPLCVLTKLQHS